MTNIFFCTKFFLKEAVTKLDKALIAKDTVILKQLLNNAVSYGHSNGWVETKAEVIKDLVTQKLTYYKIDTKDVKWTVINNVATLRNTSRYQV
ncbi:MAG: nuclear transport factor 2 family protein [Chitinophagaceae bacterium]